MTYCRKYRECWVVGGGGWGEMMRKREGKKKIEGEGRKRESSGPFLDWKFRVRITLSLPGMPSYLK